MFGGCWCRLLGDCLCFTWVHTYMALPNNVTKIFNQVFFKFALLIFNKQFILTQIVKYLVKMHSMLHLAYAVDQQVIKINGYDFIQYIMETQIYEVLKSSRHIS